MRHIADQILASTNLDSQGERLSRAFLERFCERASAAPLPVHQQHDMSKPVAGYIENIRLVPDAQNAGEWQLIGDVFYEEGDVDDVLGGFSISGMEMLRPSLSPTALVYVPFPHYNDQEFIGELTSDPGLSVGKWIKKGAEPVGSVLIGSVLVIVVAPIWDDIYKRKIAPRIDALLTRFLSSFKRNGLAPELSQIVRFRDEQVDVRLIPAKGKEASCLQSEVVHGGLAKAVDFLLNDQKANQVGVKRIVVFHDDRINAYSVHRIEYADGTVDHVA